jgi:flagella basal body P-ring formation protein FlgA
VFSKWRYTFNYTFITVVVMISVAALTAVVVSADTAPQQLEPAAAVNPAAPTYTNQMIDQLEALTKSELARQYVGARIEMDHSRAMRLVQGTLPTQVQNVHMINEPVHGEAILSVNDGAAQIRAYYRAMVPALIAKSRVFPNQRLSSDLFTRQDVNVATGMAYELKGLILPQDENVASLQTRQTIMEGQFLVSSAVEKVPDVRKGDDIRIHIISGDLNLTAGGIAAEPGYINSTIKVIVAKTKHELTGELLADGVVEVKLQ